MNFESQVCDMLKIHQPEWDKMQSHKVLVKCRIAKTAYDARKQTKVFNRKHEQFAYIRNPKTSVHRTFY